MGIAEYLRRLAGGDAVPGLQPDVRWAWVTLALSALVLGGYVIIAFKWFFVEKVAGRAESRRALRRLCFIVVCCAACGAWFFRADMAWVVWRLYDGVLVLLVLYTWSFALKMRGPGLVDDRLAQVAEIERAAEWHRETSELLPHVVWTATADGTVDFSNRRWREYVGTGCSWLDVLHPDEAAEVRDWWRGAVEARQPVAREVRLRGRAGFRTFDVRATPVVRAGGVRWLGACADVEDQKLAAVQMEVEARRKAFFLNAISHDLRAPLNNVVLNAHLLKVSARDEADVESANVIVENAVAAAELVTRLLDYAKSDGKEQDAAEVVSVRAALQQIARRFLPVAQRKGLYLRVGSGDGPEGDGSASLEDEINGDVRVRADRQKLDRVLSNLTDNAIKFTQRGGVRLDLVRPGGGASVRVTDTGVGVPPQDAPYLFDEFYQVDNYERDRSKGFGMGLAICKRLAQQLGGDVRLAASGPGGSCFELVLGGVVDGVIDGVGTGFGTGLGAGPGDRAAGADGPPGGGRRLGEAGDRPDPADAGLCRV